MSIILRDDMTPEPYRVDARIRHDMGLGWIRAWYYALKWGTYWRRRDRKARKGRLAP